MKQLPPITTKQQTILKLIYQHRFIDRTQIQILMHHKERKRSTEWLRDLRAKDYIKWIYDPTDFAGKTKPAVYYLSLNGIRFLRTVEDSEGYLVYPEGGLRARYTEASRKQGFIDRCLLVADCCLNLTAKSIPEKMYSYELLSDFADPDNPYHFLDEFRPDACFIRTEGEVVTNFLFELFDHTLPRYSLRKRLKDYVSFLDNAEWEDATGDNDPPVIELAFELKADLIYAKRRIRKLLADLYDDDTPETIQIRFATVEQIKEHGVSGKIWEKC